jgi:hypothetical protein
MEREVVAKGVIAATCAGLLAAAGCSAIFGIQADRTLVEPDGGADWSCVGGSAVPLSSANVELSILFNDVADEQASNGFLGNPIPGVTLTSCGKLDPTCASPLGTATSDDAGLAAISVTPGFDGYYEVSAANYTSSILARTAQRRSEAAQQGLAKASLFAMGGQLAGVTADPNLSFVIVTAADCQSNPAPGVTFQIGDPGSEETIVYFQNGLPSKSSTSTDATGSAMVFNAPAGTITVSGTILALQQPLPTATALVRQSWVTYLQLRPDQARYPAP